MSERGPMALWRIFDGDNTGWVAARSVQDAVAVWEREVLSPLDQFRVERVPVETVGSLRVEGSTLGEAFKACVDSGQPAYLYGSKR